MLGEINRAEITDRNLAVVGVEGDFGAEVGAVYHAHMLLGAADIAGVFEGDPGMPGLKEHGEHLAP